MAITAFTGWSATAALNVDLNSIPLDGSVMVASQVDDAFREMMAQLAGAGLATTAAVLLTANVSTAAQFRANTADKVLDTDGVWASAAEVTLTDAATIAVDFSSFINGTVTLAGNRTLGAPTNLKVGQSGVIRIIQDATGSRTLAYHADWKFAFGTDPTLTTTAAATDLLFYQVIATGFIYATLAKALA